MAVAEIRCAHDAVVKLSELKSHPENPNVHPAAQIEKLAGLIERVGWRLPVCVSNLSGFVIRGHGRMAAARRLGLTEVPVDYQDYETRDEEIADLVADNVIPELAYFDEAALAKLVQEIDAGTFDVNLLGFLDERLDELLAVIDPKTDPDEVPILDPEADAISAAGCLWRLGSHRLYCGDATDPAAVAALMGDDLAHLVFTDPPYNVDYQGSSGKRKKIENDNLSTVDFSSLISRALKNCFDFCVGGSGIYICHSDLEWRVFRESMVGAGWLLKQCLIWEKNQFVMGRQDYHWRHEPILYGWKPADGAGGHRWYGGRNKDTVLELPEGVLIEETKKDGVVITVDIGLQRLVVSVPSYQVLFAGDDDLQSIWKVQRPLRSEDHPTMKPVALVERALKNSSRHNDLVLDLFSGSGSTLIACETTRRSARAMELDPHYCDVIVKRWENFTGKKAQLVLGGDRVKQKVV